MMTKKSIAIAAPVALVGAFVPALLVLRMMADNNNNGELYDTVTGQWDMGYALQVASIAYLPAFVALFAAVVVLTRIFSRPADAS